ncbi:hypothetical protein M404DRAFT_26559 [Pisolithus tinctorius Marx 270]|uniref:Uncharacterized protein n=1 Tax=Pisolithus tinctorius Marx 270 TaxID=870435 RepID=A0A0C3J4E1_PISTI|nr:hypothetical protein M404DRAFT_26559 [Pisolithus tinctorius Marx 270]
MYSFDPAPYPMGQPLQESLTEAQELMKQQSKGSYTEFSMGDKVWLDTSDLKQDILSRKLVP